MNNLEAEKVLKARDILKSLEKVTEIDYCGLTEYELVNLIVKELKG